MMLVPSLIEMIRKKTNSDLEALAIPRTDAVLRYTCLDFVILFNDKNYIPDIFNHDSC